MDDNSQPLVLEQFGHCSQEIVNLMLTGRATTNIHDNDKVLSASNSSDADTFVLRGIGPDQEIGFLTTLEAMHLAKVGDHYKTPKYPIWVVGSSSHYTVLFSLDPLVGQISKREKRDQELKQKFHQFDPDERGLIMFDQLDEVLKSCDLDIRASDFRHYFDPDNTTCVTLQNFIKTLDLIKEQSKISWECPQCTLLNKMDDNICSACTRSKPMQATIVHLQDSPKLPEPKIPRSFIMYHYNGLQSSKVDKPQFTKLHVFDEQEITHIGSAITEELTSLIKTKWPFAVVEFSGMNAPRIA